jgi:predicted nucleic acid-binding protein
LSVALDSNILLYAFDRLEPAKRAVAEPLLRRALDGRAIIARQVLGEILNVAHRRRVMTPGEARALVSSLAADAIIVPTSQESLGIASMMSERFQLQYFDALIATLSRDAGATILLSEDMQDGIDLDGLVVLNPFSPTNADKIEAAWPRA